MCIVKSNTLRNSGHTLCRDTGLNPLGRVQGLPPRPLPANRTVPRTVRLRGAWPSRRTGEAQRSELGFQGGPGEGCSPCSRARSADARRLVSALIHGANLWESRPQARALQEAAFPRATCAQRAAARWVRAAAHGRAARRAWSSGDGPSGRGLLKASPKERRQVVAWKVAACGQSRSDQGE